MLGLLRKDVRRALLLASKQGLRGALCRRTAPGLGFLVTFVITPLIVNVLLCICLKRNDTQ